MNIAHIVCRYPPYYGGMGNTVFQTASELSKLGHNVTVITPGYYAPEEVRPASAPVAEEHTEELQAEIDYARRLEPTIAYGNAARLPDLEKELDEFDLVHFHYPFFGTANLVRKWKLRHPERPLVMTYHMDTRSDGWKGLIFKYYAKHWLPKILGTADALIGSSFDYIEASDARPIYELHREKWFELPFGVDTTRFAPRPPSPELMETVGLASAVPTILFVGGMDRAHYFKGVPALIKALVIIKERGLPMQAVLVGEGELRASYEALAERLRVRDLVRFVGAVSDHDLPDYYNLADLLVLPSVTSGEAFGMVLLEAMASGVPVIASDLPGVRSVASDGGLLTRPNDPHDIAECLIGYFMPENNRTEWRERVRALAVAKYSWGPIAAELDRIYRSLVEDSPGAYTKSMKSNPSSTIENPPV